MPQAVGVTPRNSTSLGRGQNLGDEFRHLVVGRRALRDRRTLLDGRHAATAQHVEHGQWIDAKKIAGDQRNGDGAQTHAAAAQTQAATAAHATAASVFEVVAFALVIHAHGGYSLTVLIDGVAGFERDLAGGRGKAFVLAGVENGTRGVDHQAGGIGCPAGFDGRFDVAALGADARHE